MEGEDHQDNQMEKMDHPYPPSPFLFLPAPRAVVAIVEIEGIGMA